MIPLWFSFLQFTARSALEAVGNSRALATGNAVKFVVTAGACLGGHQLAGLPGLILGVGAGSFVGYATIAAALRASGLSTFAQDVAWTAAGLGLGGVIAFGAQPLAAALGTARVDLVTLGVGAAVVGPLAGSLAGRLRALRRDSGAG
jgi:hypothetical protein